MNTVFIAVGMRLLFVDWSVMDRGVMDRSVVDRSRVVTSVVRDVVGSGLGEKEKSQGHNNDLRMM